MLRKDYFEFYDNFEVDIDSLEDLKGALLCTSEILRSKQNTCCDEFHSLSCSISFLDNVINKLHSDLDDFLEVLQND